MKKFFTAIPLQPKGELGEYYYNAVDNENLQINKQISFPILSAINGYVEKGEKFELVVVLEKSENARYNFEIFKTQLNAICEDKGIICKAINCIEIDTDESVSYHLETFQKLIEYTNEDDELFLCVTFGTKPLSMTMKLAIQYAYRIKRNTSISCVVYGKVDRTGEQEKGYLYDETAILKLDEIVRVLADRKVENPAKIVSNILSL